MLLSRLMQAVLATFVGFGLAAGAQADGGHHDSGEVAAALSTKTSAAQAIASAEEQGGGRAVKVELEREHGKASYEIELVAGHHLSVVHVDPATGEVMQTKAKTRRLDRDDRREMAEMAGSPVSLADALVAAEAKTRGRAFDARTRDIDGIVFFRVEVAKGRTVHKVTIDPNGKVVRVAAAGADEDELGERHYHENYERGEHDDD